ncbi:hypothetical protein BCF46_3511 [Litoreibacter meonggei]|uniref:Uncharacterized protein n=1 Tax=Litoreibacter meonggei TaxID=1049199 RepID=A0A497VBU9_9RHOB|nr:hypothetical protein [Litoreibacter meonggei]RLJ40940.1 hypothetical protein BCF46_3511 [Litoreibacter meonggei]
MPNPLAQNLRPAYDHLDILTAEEPGAIDMIRFAMTSSDKMLDRQYKRGNVMSKKLEPNKPLVTELAELVNPFY